MKLVKIMGKRLLNFSTPKSPIC